MNNRSKTAKIARQSGISERKLRRRMKQEVGLLDAHEMRTPLSNITEAVAQVIDGLHGKISPDQRKILKIAHRNCTRLGSLISDLFDLSRSGSGKMSLPRTFDQVKQHAEIKLARGRAV